jgi:hypothetical protein
MGGRISDTLAEWMHGMTQGVVPNVKNRPRTLPPRST